MGRSLHERGLYIQHVGEGKIGSEEASEDRFFLGFEEVHGQSRLSAFG